MKTKRKWGGTREPGPGKKLGQPRKKVKARNHTFKLYPEDEGMITFVAKVLGKNKSQIVRQAVRELVARVREKQRNEIISD